jgi:tellurite resistance protein
MRLKKRTLHHHHSGDPGASQSELISRRAALTSNGVKRKPVFPKAAMSVRPHHDALLKLMMVMSAADGRQRDRELGVIADIVRNLPVFASVTADDLVEALRKADALLDETDGIEDIIGEACAVLPARLRETAYALAVEVAASDLLASDEELRLLEMIRDTMELDPLVTAAIERSARVRYRRDSEA